MAEGPAQARAFAGPQVVTVSRDCAQPHACTTVLTYTFLSVGWLSPKHHLGIHISAPRQNPDFPRHARGTSLSVRLNLHDGWVQVRGLDQQIHAT